MALNDTIVAIATPPGKGGVGIVRVSGPGASSVAQSLLGKVPRPRYAVFAGFRDADGNILDEGLALYFPGPHSFTGEDVLELQAHGGPVILDSLVGRCLQLGARQARPGEFSERAFHNGKLDLAQAEAVADLIDAGSNAAARSALRSLQGEFSEAVNAIVHELTQLRVYVEAAIDFPEEEIDFLADKQVSENLVAIEKKIKHLLHRSHQGRLLRDGLTLVLAGPPNAGKSSLLNMLSGQDSAIVSAIPGTTRDVLREYINLDGLPLHIMDTAGLRESGDDIEQQGVSRAHQAMSRADHILIISDDNQPQQQAIEQIISNLPVGVSHTLIKNKIDLTGRPPGRVEGESERALALSVITGKGCDVLREHLKSLAGFETEAEGVFISRRRHITAIECAQAHVLQGRQCLESTRAGELLAEELRLAQQALSEITGEFLADDLLGEIFSGFCIGK
ncbi:MAG: tRNA uridine-5-carboxymethylaminomethyl(34) synthesis GTPase MnmE [Gammaproteobacteria bacterium]|nr:MAG: tRNA uridine-5-carboxymethylaminomethyl(34) synthesis GTPase MnmE [Gammaproteobacteria bacterium]